MRCCLFFTLLFTASIACAQSTEIYPTHWWAGMKWNKVQLLLRNKSALNNPAISIIYPGVTVNSIHPFANKKYIAIDITISALAKPGTIDIAVSDGGNRNTIKWELKKRRTGNGRGYAQGVGPSDFIYLLMPDRFSNGNSSNDRIEGMRDQSLNRDSIFLRHGGDMQGIINHLDYLQGLGVTALWMTPVIENDMPDRTEHGYAFTNHYTIEPRLGGDTVYKRLSDSLHRHGMKLIQDAVYNHIGLYHFLMQDPPDTNWIHQWPQFTKPNYKDQVHFDPYVSQKDKKQMVNGWFTMNMPDMNQSNPFVANFLIQHAIWSVEEFGIDAWRIDTYIYVDLPFMNRCNQALLTEYPHMTMFGESWVESSANQAFFTRNNFNIPFKSNLPAPVDFQCTFHGIQPALTDTTNGANQLYTTLGRDFVYQQPMNNIIFLDNHDMSRIFSVVHEDVKKQKMGIMWLLTERGVPQMYYGTEVLMKGMSNPDGWVRLDFPGGWTGDKKNAFTGDGLSQDEQAVQNLTRKLGMFRKTSSALRSGKMMHYVPQNGLYVYFRYDAKQTIMCIMNTSNHTNIVNFQDYAERTAGFTTATDVLSGQSSPTAQSRNVEGGDMLILELTK